MSLREAVAAAAGWARGYQVHNGVESDNYLFLEAQNAILQHLQKHGVNCPQPMVCPASQPLLLPTLPPATAAANTASSHCCCQHSTVSLTMNEPSLCALQPAVPEEPEEEEQEEKTRKKEVSASVSPPHSAAMSVTLSCCIQQRRSG